MEELENILDDSLSQLYHAVVISNFKIDNLLSFGEYTSNSSQTKISKLMIQEIKIDKKQYFFSKNISLFQKTKVGLKIQSDNSSFSIFKI